MRRIAVIAMFLTALAAGGFAQQWEFGGLGGGGFLNNVNVSGPAGSATAGFASGAAFGGFVGQNLYTHWSGELHYAYLENDLRIKSGATNATFSGNSQVVHYDMLYHTNRKGSRAQFFAAVGGGIKIFNGTGAEAAYQPNYQFGYLTKTQQLKPMADVGFGVRVEIRPHLFLRTEVRDFITAFPSQVIAPAPGTHYGSILQDLVPMAGISYEK